MLLNYGLEYNLRNIYMLASSKGHSPKSFKEMKNLFLEFLSTHQYKHPINISGDRFIRDEKRSDALKEAYNPSSLNDLNQSNVIGPQLDEAKIDELIVLLKNGIELLSTEHKLLFPLIIHSIFFRESNINEGLGAFGGSSSSAIGSIWVSGKREISKYDAAEFIVHEITHHLLFIDERCRAQFNYEEIKKKENYSLSAILLKKRPLDKVIHSIVVASELVLARRNFLGDKGIILHKRTPDLTKDTLCSINEVLSMDNINHLITPHTLSIINNCQKALS